MKKRILIVVLLYISINTVAQKNSFLFEGGIPFGWKESKELYSGNLYNRNNNYTIGVSFSRQFKYNILANIGYKYKAVNDAISSEHYTGDWITNNLYIGAGYHLPLYKNFFLNCYANIGYSHFVYYMQLLDTFLIYPANLFSPQGVAKNTFFVNMKVIFGYKIKNWIIYAGVDYEHYFIGQNQLDYYSFFMPQEDLQFNFNSSDITLGIGYTF